MRSNSKPNDLTRIILEVINEKKPQSVRQLTGMLNQNFGLAEEEIVESIMKLKAEGVIKLENQTIQLITFIKYLKTFEVIWYWATIATGLMTAALVFTIPENIYPWIYARNVLGVVFVLFLPGYSFVKAFFQNHMVAKTSVGNLETIERLTLSIGMSLALVSIMGLLLYYSPWGLNLTSVVPSLLAFTLLFATVAVIRAYQAKKNNLKRAFQPL